MDFSPYLLDTDNKMMGTGEKSHQIFIHTYLISILLGLPAQTQKTQKKKNAQIEKVSNFWNCIELSKKGLVLGGFKKFR